MNETRIPIRIFNALAKIWANGDFNPDEILETAAKRFGSNDFGDDQFLTGFNLLCRSLKTEANLHSVGRIVARNMILKCLHSRSELSQRWKEYPTVLKKPIKKPIFIVGPARSGTTFLFNLLALDDRFRFFRAWEARFPGLKYDDKIQMRVKKAQKKTKNELEVINYIRPGFKKIHHMECQKPEECNILLTNSFEAIIFRYMFEVNSYYDWYNEQDHIYAYTYYKKQLQWAQSNTPGKRWLLKSPSHLTAFKTLVDHFPDATFIQTHRDLQESVPSNCSLKYNLQSISSSGIDRKKIGDFVMHDLWRSLHTTFNVRALNSLNIFDIKYIDLIKYPITVLEQIYEYLGEEFNGTVKNRVMEFLASNPKDQFGRHVYSIEEFGLDKQTIFKKFDFYYDKIVI